MRIAATPRVRNVIIFARRLAKRLSIVGVLFAADEERGEYEVDILCRGIAKEQNDDEGETTTNRMGMQGTAEMNKVVKSGPLTIWF